MFNNRIKINGHTKQTIVGDILIVILSVIFSLSQSCVSGDYPACLIFCFLIIVIIIIKYFKINNKLNDGGS